MSPARSSARGTAAAGDAPPGLNRMDHGKEYPRPLSVRDWLTALPWLILIEAAYLVPYLFTKHGLPGKLYWDEHPVSHNFPLAHLAREEVLSGFFPLWNHLSGAGMPLLANTLDETLLPYAILKYLLPFPAGLTAYMAVKVMIALAGCHAAGREFGARRSGAILLAAVFTFSGFIVHNINGVVGPIFLMPWCLYGMHRLARKPDAFSAVVVALAFGLSLLGGNPQIPFLSLLIGYGLYLAILSREGATPSVGRYVLLPGAAVSLGALLALPQLLPFIEYLSRAWSHHLPGWGGIHVDPRGIVGVPTLLWHPAILYMGSLDLASSVRDTVIDKFPPRSYADAAIPFPFEYIGFVAVLFFILALIRLRKLRVEGVFFALVFIISLGLAFGFFPFSLISRLPPFDQITNWRLTTYPAGFSGGVLAALLLPEVRAGGLNRAWIAFFVCAALTAVGMAVIATQAGLPLTALPVAGAAAGTVAFLLLLAAALASRRAWPVVVFAAIELIAYDQLTNLSVMPHPHRALERSERIVECAGRDPAYRFSARGEVIHPNLGILLGLNDVRTYEMIFPERYVRWIGAVNRWDRVDTLAHYLTHYYFAPEPKRLDSPAARKAAISAVLSDDFPPGGALSADALAKGVMIAPSPAYFHQAEVTIEGVTRKGWFMHAPARAAIGMSGRPRLAASAAMTKASWEMRGDGVTMQMFSEENLEAGGPRSLLYSRYLDPKNRPGERAWLPAPPFEIDAPVLAASVTPGPRGDDRSDHGLWMDFHEPGERRRFERTWRPVERGPVKCYRREDPLPRLRVAKRVETVDSFEECLAGIREDRWDDSTEAVVDPAGGKWPDGEARLTEVEYGSNRVSAMVEASGPATVVLADNHYPGWRARIDGEPTAIHLSGCNFRAVRVPAGEHDLVMTFEPASFKVGLWAGMLSWIVFLAAVIGPRRKSRRGESATGVKRG